MQARGIPSKLETDDCYSRYALVSMEARKERLTRSRTSSGRQDKRTIHYGADHKLFFFL